MDITSDGSPGHIFKKASRGWQTKDYVSEILYPALNLGSIASDGGIGARARHAFERTQKREAIAKVKLAAELENIYELHNVSAPARTEESFEGYFDDYTFSHDMIRSLIELGGQILLSLDIAEQMPMIATKLQPWNLFMYNTLAKPIPLNHTI